MKRIAVVGLGYVGIPLACSFSRSGFDVIGIDINESKIKAINEGICPIVGKEPGLKELFEDAHKNHGLRATNDFSKCGDADAIFICVDTPIDERTKIPGFEALRAAVSSIGENLQEGALVSIESTIAPGTTSRVVKPILEEKSGMKVGEDLHLAHCPERLKVGKLLQNLIQCDRVIGGIDAKSAEVAKGFYEHISKGELLLTDALTAEVVKTTENAYRDVEIAFANELALICEKLGIDVFQTRQLVNTSPDRHMHEPGSGVGGHCLPKDSWLLLYGAEMDPEGSLISLARDINDMMPHHLFNLTREAFKEAGRNLEGSNVAIMGFAFIEDSDDARNTPSLPVIERLRENGARIIVHDPYANGVEGVELTRDLDVALREADAAVFVTKHEVYRSLTPEELKSKMRGNIVVDGRNIFGKSEIQRAGVVYRAIGK
ncbi:MAG: nucleotide sugar dehydrogenase [Thermoplasmata archaeon]